MDRESDFRDMFAYHYARMVRTVFLILQDWDRSEEVTQDAFVQLLRHWRRVVDYEQPDAWVRRVAIRLAVQASNREQRLASAMLRSQPPSPDSQALEDTVSVEVLAVADEGAVLLETKCGRVSLAAALAEGIDITREQAYV